MCLPYLPLRTPHMTGPSFDPWKHCGFAPITAVGRWNSGLRAPSCLFTSPNVPGERETHLRLLAQRRLWVCVIGGLRISGRKEQKGWCNLIGGHSCINRGIQEFLSAWWNWLCMNGPSFPPEMGHFPHVSMNMTTSPAILRVMLEVQHQLGVAWVFSRAVKFSLSDCLGKRPHPSPAARPVKSSPIPSKKPKQNKPTTAGRVRGQLLLVSGLWRALWLV